MALLRGPESTVQRMESRFFEKIEKKFALSNLMTTFAIPFGGEQKIIDNTERETR